MALSLVSSNDQDGILKSNTAPLLAVVTDKNLKEHPQNKNNEKEMLQWNRSISALSLKLKQNSELKYVKTKKAKSVNTEVIQFIPEQDLHPNCLCLLCLI